MDVKVIKKMDEVTEKALAALENAITKEVELYDKATEDDERRLHEARIKDLVKSLDEMRQVEVGTDKYALELTKVQEIRNEGRRTRIFDGIKTFLVAGVGLLGTCLGIRASRKNMEILSEYEKEHYIATTAEKKAVDQACDVDNISKKFNRR